MSTKPLSKKFTVTPASRSLDLLSVRAFQSAQSRNHPIAAACGAAQLKSNQLGSTVSPAPGQSTMQVVPSQADFVPEKPVPQVDRAPRRQARSDFIDLDSPGYQRIDSVLRILGGISKSSLYANLKRRGGPYPDPVKLGTSRAVGFRNSDLKALLALLDQQAE